MPHAIRWISTARDSYGNLCVDSTMERGDVNRTCGCLLCVVDDLLDLSLDRGAEEAAPFGPGAVVVADVRVAEELGQDEPGVAGALANPAVGDHVLVGGDALAA